MTRINTNISSLLAQNSLAKSQQQLQTSLTRLSTGLRINSGADDPSGMIASTALQSNITSINSAISNSQTAEQMISTADSGLGQISSLLNSIQGLVTSAANNGALSSDQIAADQSQIDSSLSAINQIATSTSFQGQNLLDGTLAFNVTKGTGASNISSLQVNQANLSSGPQQVNVNVTAAAKQAQLDANSIAAGAGSGTAASATVALTGHNLTFTAPSATGAYNGVAVNFIQQAGVNAAGGPTATYNASAGTLNITVDNSSDTTGAQISSAVQAAGFTVTGTTTGTTYHPTATAAQGAAATAASKTITFADGAQLLLTANSAGSAHTGDTIAFTTAAQAAPTAAFAGTTLTITASNTAGSTTTLDQLAQAINTDGTYSATVLKPGVFQQAVDVTAAGTGTPTVITLTHGVAMTFTATTDGAATPVVNMIEKAGQGTTPSAVWDASANNGVGELDITIDSSAGVTTNVSDIKAAVAKAGSPLVMTGTGTVVGSGTAGTVTAGVAVAGTYDGLSTTTTGGTNAVTGADTTFSGGTSPAGGLLDNLTFQLSGSAGSQTFAFTAGATLGEVINAVNAQSGSTGVTAASNANDGLTFSSTGYGSNAFVGVNVVSEDGSKTFTNGLKNHTTNAAATRVTGSDVQGTINGVAASGSGNTLSVNNSNLSASMDITAGATGQMNFTVASGGALFQLGPNVIGSEQARLGIQSVDSANLGGSSGLMLQLGSGGSASLATSPSLANSIVSQAITQVSDLRGRLGAFQSTTLESNVSSLQNTLQNLTSAQSSISDADFAAESANLTRAQVLQQSGVAVLAVANKQPQQILSLLQNL